jgi:hypothetical protein
MEKFVVLYFCSMEDQMAVSQQPQEEREKGMAHWFEWQKELGDKLVDFGAPLFGSARINKNGSFTESALELTGYSIIQAEDLDEAKELVKNHPHFTYGDSCAVEVHEIMDMGM